MRKVFLRLFSPSECMLRGNFFTRGVRKMNKFIQDVSNYLSFVLI